MSVRLAPNLLLTSPVVAASGTLGFGEEIADLADCSVLGALITPTLTLDARVGNPMPRTVEASAGLIHSTGLPNPGLDLFLSDRLPRMSSLPCPVIASIAAESEEDWAHLARRLSVPGILVALELNLTPFRLLLTERAYDPPASEVSLLASISAAVSAVRAATSLPILAKLPAVGADTGAAARAAAASGADVISLVQAFPAVAVRAGSRDFRLPGIAGGLSGPCIKPMALYQVWQAAQAVETPILGGGGIMTGEDAVEFLAAGASAVSVGIASMVQPAVAARIVADLESYLNQRDIPTLRSLTGQANKKVERR